VGYCGEEGDTCSSFFYSPPAKVSLPLASLKKNQILQKDGKGNEKREGVGQWRRGTHLPLQELFFFSSPPLIKNISSEKKKMVG
jgi:hypothetical protein